MIWNGISRFRRRRVFHASQTSNQTQQLRARGRFVTRTPSDRASTTSVDEHTRRGYLGGEESSFPRGRARSAQKQTASRARWRCIYILDVRWVGAVAVALTAWRLPDSRDRIARSWGDRRDAACNCETCPLLRTRTIRTGSWRKTTVTRVHRPFSRMAFD